MPEPRNDMFPEQSQTTQVVSEDVTTQVPVVTVKEETETTATQTPKGSQTPETNLYAALKEERTKRQALEARLESLETNSQSSVPSNTPDDIYSDEGKIILQQIEPLKQTIESLQDKLVLKDIVTRFPILQGKEEELKEYLKDYPKSKVEVATKIFMQEQGLLEPQPIRQGLESSTGGQKQPEETGRWTAEEVDRIRTTQPRLFIKLIREGAIDPDSIK